MGVDSAWNYSRGDDRGRAEVVRMTPGSPPGDDPAGVFVRVSGMLLSAEAMGTALRLITAAAKEVFPGAIGAGFTLADLDGRRVTAAATDDVVARADALQYELGQGPCLTAWERRTAVRVDDLGREHRWPEWVAAVRGTGLRSALSTPVLAGGQALGAMKVYASEPGAFGGREEHLLTMFATQAGVLLADMRTTEDARRVDERLKDALRGRDAITLAKGIIISRDGADERAAFLTLAELARRRRATLRDTAEELVRTTIKRPF
ncbi:GAF and ANTAR domain-containing protein [Actinosynnema sp. NPDC053489]|uniref:GAF and ANTAR domain-containing protein n=1 Tax=Actinosynnema sp. NPDC053489 TaxID=3363916 RepID=UPI0037C8A7A8